MAARLSCCCSDGNACWQPCSDGSEGHRGFARRDNGKQIGQLIAKLDIRHAWDNPTSERVSAAQAFLRLTPTLLALQHPLVVLRFAIASVVTSTGGRVNATHN